MPTHLGWLHQLWNILGMEKISLTLANPGASFGKLWHPYLSLLSQDFRELTCPKYLHLIDCWGQTSVPDQLWLCNVFDACCPALTGICDTSPGRELGWDMFLLIIRCQESMISCLTIRHIDASVLLSLALYEIKRFEP